MAATVSRVLDTVVGAQRKTVSEITFDSSYPTGGEAVTASQLGFGVAVLNASTTIKTVGGTVNVANAYYDIPNGKVLVYDETPAEVSDTATLATLVVQIEAYGH
jgi:hypothetical protein